MIDDVTGLPLLSSDIYQIPLNADTIPYNDLQAESRLPRQPLLPDDIIPTIALTTGLRSDGTGEVVHTDDHHAQWVYVVNQPVSSGGGSGSGIEPNHYDGQSDFNINDFDPAQDVNFGPNVGSGLITDVRVCAVHDPQAGGFTNTAGRILLAISLHDDHNHWAPIGNILLYYHSTDGSRSVPGGEFQIKYPTGFDPAAYGMVVGDSVALNITMTGAGHVLMSALLGWHA